ncbi:MAG: pentapeptide repeat-containing protein [Sphingobacterium sp.]|uniref:pentapeptide repeat-containing protein n=1 Tax=Sphingobacterium sp. JB170 TaxID=1434842 RepID=UPI00097EAAAD|nr:pentapeptide repeat-containing protein [Sphingobacterium sp. JB170]SJN31154.1 Related to MCBG protein [Sphingobacterium sp. JB170]
MYIQEKIFKKVNNQAFQTKGAEFENCVFDSCSFNQGDFTDSKFISCSFVDCDLSSAILARTSFQEVKFEQCKMMGLIFDRCDTFGLSFAFESCQLSYSSFFNLKIKQTHFSDSILHYVDFSQTDLSDGVLNNCDLDRATFGQTILEKTDFRTSFNYIIDPENNKINKAKFSLSSIAGLLAKYNIKIER